MKTPEQIKEWMQQQEWYPKFVKNVELYGEEYILDRAYNHLTITGAFRWDRTEEGYIFWMDINKVFLKWYN